MEEQKTIRISEIKKRFPMALSCYSLKEQYVQCRTYDLRVCDFQYFEELGTRLEVVNQTKLRFFFPDELKLVEDWTKKERVITLSFLLRSNYKENFSTQ